MRYEDALKEARADLMGLEDDRDIVVFQARCPEAYTFEASLTDIMLAAVALAYDESQPVTVYRQRGGVYGPWVEVRKVTVSIEVTDPEVRS